MTADQLNKMQAAARERYKCPFPVVEKIPVKKERKEKTLSQVLEENFDFIDGELKLKKKRGRKPKPKNIMPDLMAAQLSLPCTSDIKTEPIPETKKPEVIMSSSPVFNKPYVPKPVQEKKVYHKSVVVSPEPTIKKWERPKAVYSNIPSPYGIASELLAEQLKEGR